MLVYINGKDGKTVKNELQTKRGMKMEAEDTNSGDKLQECTYCYNLYSPNDRKDYSFEEVDSGLCPECEAKTDKDYHYKK